MWDNLTTFYGNSPGSTSPALPSTMVVNAAALSGRSGPTYTVRARSGEPSSRSSPPDTPTQKCRRPPSPWPRAISCWMRSMLQRHSPKNTMCGRRRAPQTQRPLRQGWRRPPGPRREPGRTRLRSATSPVRHAYAAGAPSRHAHAGRPHSAYRERNDRPTRLPAWPGRYGPGWVAPLPLRAPLRIKLPDQRRILLQRLGRAHVSTRCPAHSPSEARKVASPLSALIPAPVRTKTRSTEITMLPLHQLQPLSSLLAFRSGANRMQGSNQPRSEARRGYQLKPAKLPLRLQQNLPCGLARFHVGLRLRGVGQAYTCSVRSFSSPLAAQPSTSLARHSSSARVAM